MESTAGRRRGPLFDIPAWRDWVFWLGIISGGLTTLGSIISLFDETSPNLGFFTGNQIAILVVVATLSFMLGFLPTGVAVAFIRKSQKRNHPTPFGGQADEQTKDTSLLILPIMVIVLSIFVADLYARSLFSDTTEADRARTAREATNNLTAEQRESFRNLDELPQQWNKLSFQWDDIYENPNLGFSKFESRAKPILDAMQLLMRRATESQDSLVDSDAGLIFADLVLHHSEKLEVIKGLTTAIAVGDAVSEEKLNLQLENLNKQDKIVICTTIVLFLVSPFVGSLTEAEYQRRSEMVSKC